VSSLGKVPALSGGYTWSGLRPQARYGGARRPVYRARAVTKTAEAGWTAAGGDDADRADAAVRSDVDGAEEDVNRLITTFAVSS
jgi:hypothetical protein